MRNFGDSSIEKDHKELQRDNRGNDDMKSALSQFDQNTSFNGAYEKFGKKYLSLEQVPRVFASHGCQMCSAKKSRRASEKKPNCRITRNLAFFKYVSS